MILIREGVSDKMHKSNGAVLRMLCCVYETGIVQKLVEAGIGGSLLWVNRGLVKKVFQRDCFVFLRVDSEGLLRVLLDHAPRDFVRSSRLWINVMSSVAFAFGWTRHESLEYQTCKYTSLLTMLLCAGVDYRQAVRVLPYEEIHLPFKINPMAQVLLCRREAIIQNELDRKKVEAFFAGRWGRFLGRDIVQSHILPFAVTLGGRAQNELDALLEREGFRRDVGECRFYYQCLLRGLVNDPFTVWEFRFLEYVRDGSGLQEITQMCDALGPTLPGVDDDDVSAHIEDESFTIVRHRFALRNGVAIASASWWPFYGQCLC